MASQNGNWRGIQMHCRSVFHFTLFSLLVLTGACSSSNPEAPPAGSVHAERYILSHAAEATVDLNSCKSCHKSDFRGTFKIADCLSCHTDGTPFSVHPLPFKDPALHGPAALVSQKNCLGCHGRAPNRFDGGLAADPGLFANPEGNCLQCHARAGAHPDNWRGGYAPATQVYQATHRAVARQTIETSCALCHQVIAEGPEPLPQAPSCFSSGYTNKDGIASGCHAGGPGDPAHELPFSEPGQHGPAAKRDLTSCQSCHGTPGTLRFDGGSTATACSTCHQSAGAHPTTWAGSDPTRTYVAGHSDAADQSKACAICHDVSQGRPAPNPNAPSCFSTAFANADGTTHGCHASGPSAPHALPFTDPALHGPQAKSDLSACVACHATPADAGPGDNPRFNRTVGDLAAGCENCHTVQSAHPTPLWSGTGDAGHRTAGNMSAACALCHGKALNGPAGGGVAKDCASCHSAGSPLTQLNCSSCHSAPPSGQSAPNFAGAHAPHRDLSGLGDDCRACHDGAGNGSAVHRADSDQDVRMLSLYRPKSGANPQYDPAARTCANVSCHGGRTTPAWDGGAIDVDNDCLSCHSSGTSQYNGYRDEAHTEEGHRDLTCIACHDPAKLRITHFSNLATPGFDGDPADTLRNCTSCHDD